jgi:predicted dehydrogenase
MDPMTPPRLAVIGLGGIAQAVHLPLIQRNRDRVELAAVADLSPRALDEVAGGYGIGPAHRYRSAAELAEAVRERHEQVDGAILATSGAHADDALMLVRAGVRVLAEKPLAYSLDEIDRLVGGVERLHRDPAEWIRVGYMKEHDPAVQMASRLLESASVRAVDVEVLHPADDRQLRFARARAWGDADPEALARSRSRMDEALERAVGGVRDDKSGRALYAAVILGSIVHDLALTRHLGVPLERIFHASRTGPSFPGSVTVSGSTRGAPWTLGWHFIAGYPEYRETITIHHESGSLEIAFRTPYILNAPTVLTCRSAGGADRSDVAASAWPQEEAFDRELTAFLGLIRGEDAPGSGPREAREDLVVAQRLWRACAVSAGVRVDPSSEAGGRVPDGATFDDVKNGRER